MLLPPRVHPQPPRGADRPEGPLSARARARSLVSRRDVQMAARSAAAADTEADGGTADDGGGAADDVRLLLERVSALSTDLGGLRTRWDTHRESWSHVINRSLTQSFPSEEQTKLGTTVHEHILEACLLYTSPSPRD